jgi:hypothetical protein
LSPGSLFGEAKRGFGEVARRPGLIAAWTLAGVVMNLGLQLLLPVLVGADLVLLGAPGAAEGTAAHWAAYVRVEALQTALSCVLFAIPICAVYRVLLRPEEDGFAYLRLGAEELRIALLLFLLIGTWWVVVLGGYALIPRVVAPMVVALPEPWNLLAYVVLTLAPLALITVWLAVRFSLAGPASFTRRRLAFGHAWRMTRGRFRPLFAVVAASVALAAMMLAARTRRAPGSRGRSRGSGSSRPGNTPTPRALPS